MKLSSALFKAIVLSTFLVSSANAALIRVSQESSAGAGDFDANVLGNISSFNTGLTIANFYRYDNPDFASYNGDDVGGPSPVSSTTMSFFVAASDGLNLVTVHDNINDGSGGTTRMSWSLTGDTAGFTVGDDPSEGLTNVGGTGTTFRANHGWAPCCTDGFALGSLDNNWALFGEFDSPPTGITAWNAVSGSGGPIALNIANDRRVRFDVVPEPSIIALFGLGLLGLGFTRRKARS